MDDINTLDQEIYAKLRFGMTPQELEELEAEHKARKKRIAKGWRPEGH